MLMIFCINGSLADGTDARTGGKGSRTGPGGGYRPLSDVELRRPARNATGGR